MRTPVRVRCVAALACTAAVLLVGCGTEEPARRAGTIDRPATAQNDDTGNGGDRREETPDQADRDLSAAGRQLTRAEAKAALPPVTVLPAGWSVDPENTLTDDEDEDDSDDQVTPARCQVVFDGLEALEDDKDPVAEASVTYTAGMLGPFVGVKVLSFTDEIAEDRFDRVLDALSECPKFTIDDGETVTPFRVSALSFPNYGEESAALRMSASSEGMAFALDFVAIRTGHNAVYVSQMAIGGAGSVKPLQKAAKVTMTNLARD